jgi:MFS family permease
LPVLFVALAGAAALTATWVGIAAPSLPVLPRHRFTVADLARQLIHRNFLVPVAGLTIGAAALGASVGFLPVAGQRDGLGVVGSVAAVTVLAVASAVAQRLVGQILDRGLLTALTGLIGSVALIAASLAVEAVFHNAALFYSGALLLGIGIGAATSLGFAQLATTTPPDRMGRTMGSAELGREVGDAGGPIVVGAIAVGFGLSTGLGALAGVAAITAGLIAILTRKGRCVS